MHGNSFVGRERDVAELAGLPSTTQLVTIVGAGGVGKTRLAIETMAELGREQVAAGGREPQLVELASFERNDMLHSSVAAALGCRSVEAAAAAIEDDPALVVLDNCEHVIDQVADLASTLLAACPRLRILATSRTPLEIAGEHVHPLRPLSPDRGLDLLRQRAKAAGADLPAGSITDEALRELVDSVDAVPLAIELAAIRLRSLDPAQIVEALEENVEVLRIGRGTGRHASLTAAIDWSYALLDGDEATALRRLSILSGPFDLDVAHAVIAGDGTGRVATADMLDRLVAQSMLSPRRQDGGMTYRFLDLIRRFAHDKLERSGELEETRERYLSFVADRSAGLVERAVTEWTEDVVVDALSLGPDLLVALRLCLDNDETGERAMTMFLPAWGLVHEHRAGELAVLGAELLERWGPETPGWGDVAAITATASMRLSRAEVATRQANEAVAAGGLIAVPVAQRVLAMAAQHGGDFERALASVRIGLDEAESLGLAPFAAELQVFEATLLGQLGRNDEAVERARVAVERNRKLASAPVATWSLVLEAYLLADSDPARSADLEQAARSEVELDSVQWIVARHIGALAVKRGDHASACFWLRKALHSARRAGEVPQAWAAMRWIAVLAAEVDRLEPAQEAGPRSQATVAAAKLLAVTDASPDTPAPGALERPLLEAARARFAAPVHPVGADQAHHLADEVLDGLDAGLADVSAPEPAVHDAAAAAAPVAGFVRRGEVWRLTWDGRSADFADRKGLADLAVLLAQPGREIHALDLMGAAVDESGVDGSVDAQAKRRYEERLRELQVEIELANERNDLGRAERAQTEFDEIVDALSKAFGLGGRARTSGDAAEKARSAVTARIRSTINRIEEHLPALANHLRRSVKTGFWCAYNPESLPDWELT